MNRMETVPICAECGAPALHDLTCPSDPAHPLIRVEHDDDGYLPTDSIPDEGEAF